jgi:cytidyltransferase-like protein|tara:strand:- start:212 stop:622 length:411 start_codon:yes stop_codon:yes gene_type:complete
MSVIVAVSGGFDPMHAGHVQLFELASKIGKVVVILNSDDWLTRKKGKAWMEFKDRAYVLQSCRFVTGVVPVDDSDDTVCQALREMRPDFFANGGDRVSSNTPELFVCKKIGVEMLFNVGGEKIYSSSDVETTGTSS